MSMDSDHSNVDTEVVCLERSDVADPAKEQRLKRRFGLWSLVGFLTTTQASWEVIFFGNTTAMLNGGPSTLIYGILVSVMGTLTIASSLAEMASMFPTSAGQYYWTSRLASKPHVFLSWLTGYIATIGWLGLTAAGSFITGTMIQGIMIQLHPSYVFHRWHGTLLMWAVMLVAFSVNVAGTRLLSIIESTVLVLHLAAFVAVLAPLLCFSNYGSTHDVFVAFHDAAGWGSSGLSWFIGFAIAGNLPFLGVDAPAHMAEEVQNPAINVPRAMIGSVAVNGVLAFGTAIALGYCIVPTFSKALATPTGYDFIEVFHAAMGRAGTAGLTSLIIVFGGFAPTFGFLATASRQMWAFSRDSGVPFSEFFSRVDPRLAIPLRTITFCSIFACLLGLINIGSTVAFNAITSVATAGIFISQLIPILLIIIKKCKGDVMPLGPWYMGKIGLPINVIAAVYITVSTFFSFWPPARPVTAVSMNWSCAVFGGSVFAGLCWYWLIGKRHYIGPIKRSQH